MGTTYAWNVQANPGGITADDTFLFKSLRWPVKLTHDDPELIDMVRHPTPPLVPHTWAFGDSACERGRMLATVWILNKDAKASVYKVLTAALASK